MIGINLYKFHILINIQGKRMIGKDLALIMKGIQDHATKPHPTLKPLTEKQKLYIS